MKSESDSNITEAQIETKLVEANNQNDFESCETKVKFETTICSTTNKSGSEIVKDAPRSEIIDRCAGIFYAIVASVLFTLSAFVIKQLNVDVFDTLISRFVVQSILCFSFIKFKKYSFFIGSSRLIRIQISRALVGSLGFILFYASYIYIPLPDLTTVRYTQVVWTVILAAIFFRERITKVTLIAALLTLLGVVCVAQPTVIFGRHATSANQTKNNELDVSILLNLIDQKSHRIVGFSLAIVCAISMSLSIVLNKHLIVWKIPPTVILYQFSTINLLVLSIYHLFHRFVLDGYKDRSMFTRSYFIAGSISILQIVSSMIFQKSIKLEHPSIISIVQSSDILFATLLQNIFTNEKSNFLVFIGGTLVTASIFLVGIQKLWQDDKKSSKHNQSSRV